ncbi:MAG: ATP-binding protein, partial [Alphaproteobacteria bacterium]
DNDGLVKYMNFCESRLGSKYFLTPRIAVQQFVGLLNVLEQNPGKTMEDFLKSPDQPTINMDSTIENKKNKPDEDDLIKFKL